MPHGGKISQANHAYTETPSAHNTIHCADECNPTTLPLKGNPIGGEDGYSSIFLPAPIQTQGCTLARFPQIDTQRCTLEQFTERHLTDRYVSWLNDPEVVRYSEQRHKTHDLESCQGYMKSFDGTPHYFIAISETHQGLGHIGNLNVYVDQNNQSADVGILLGHREIWGQGYGVEVWTAVCDYLLHNLGLRKITAGTSANNIGMRNIMKRTGMVEDGQRKRQLLIEGEEIDIVYAALFKE